jgi:uracil phosphoribosyltransferase
MDTVITVAHHPLLEHRFAGLRSANTDQITFGRLVHEITTALAYTAFQNLSTVEISIDTPVASGVTAHVIEEEVLLIPILRAGLGMIPALQETLPVTRVCHVGLRRNETTLESEVYLDALPEDMTGAKVVICDPMLATGGSLAHATAMVLERGATDVLAMCVLASEEGMEAFHRVHPTIPVVVGAIDPELNDHGYIIPGLGDAGDRLFGAPVRPSS